MDFLVFARVASTREAILSLPFKRDDAENLPGAHREGNVAHHFARTQRARLKCHIAVLALFRLKRSVMQTLAVCAALGLAWPLAHCASFSVRSFGRRSWQESARQHSIQTGVKNDERSP